MTPPMQAWPALEVRGKRRRGWYRWVRGEAGLVVRRATAARVVPVVPEAEQGPAVRQERVVRRVLSVGGMAGAGGEPAPTGHYCFDLTSSVGTVPATCVSSGPTGTMGRTGPVAADGRRRIPQVLSTCPRRIWYSRTWTAITSTVGACAPATDNAIMPIGCGRGVRTNRQLQHLRDLYPTDGRSGRRRGSGGAGGEARPSSRSMAACRSSMVAPSIKGQLESGAAGKFIQNVDYAGLVGRDAPLMEAAGINVVRTYGPLTDRVSSTRSGPGIYVMNTVYSWGGSLANSVVNPINRPRTIQRF